MSPLSMASKMSDNALKARLFLTRKNGDMVPLVVADELPHHIVIGDVPRLMTPLDLTPGMHCVAQLPFRHRNHTVSALADDNTKMNRVESIGGHLKAQFFITRENGAMVPAIAMDEMPRHVVVENVPRLLSVSEIIGMTSIGTHESRDKVHTVENVNNVPLEVLAKKSLGLATNKQASDMFDSTPTPRASTTHVASSAPREPHDSAMISPRALPVTPQNLARHNSMVSEVSVQSVSTFPQMPTRNGENHAVPSIAAPKEDVNSTQAKKNFLPGVKEYCSYWIRHGECDYAQQGCLYKHEMPLDPRELERLGLRDIPKWYRERHQLGSFLAAGGSGAAFSGVSLKSAVANGVQQEATQPKQVNSWQFGQWRESVRPFNNGRTRGFYSRPRFNQSRRQMPAPTRDDKPGETLHSRQQAETLKALDAIEKAERERLSAAELLKSKWSIKVSKAPVTTDHEEADASGSSSETTNTAATPVSVPSSPSPVHVSMATPQYQILQRPARRASITSALSDIEGAVCRADAARRAKEDEEYRKICETYKQKEAIENSEAAAEVKVKDKAVEHGTISSTGKGKGQRGGYRGRGKKNRGPRSSSTQSGGGAKTA